jgi:Arc/MetJ-type ribon-helix-helix transcriptional regulator
MPVPRRGARPKVVTVKLPQELGERLERIAAETGASKSTLVREALVAFLDEEVEAGEGPTVHMRSGREIGSVAGPGVSAADPSRMLGYGG